VCPKKVLVIVAHQDDETIGCGGTINKWSSTNQCEVSVLFITDGQTGIDQRGLYTKNNITSTRMIEAFSAAEVLGIKDLDTLMVPCQQIDEHSQELFHRVISVIRLHKPELVITHSPQDKHRDHRAVSKIVAEACWKAKEDIHNELGEVHTVSDVWGTEITDLHDKVDFAVKLSNKNLKAKLSALAAYSSQEKIIEGMASNIEGMAKVRGYSIGTKYAEGFKRISSTPIIL
tara:strand:+ start:1647 stop:2339 length:693 start_codon:yes stop_codon:yes gene_type:complete